MSNFGSFFNDPDLEKIDGFIRGILSVPTESSGISSDAISSDFISNFFEKESEKKTGKSEINQLLNQFEVPPERIARYNAYDEIFRSVPLVKRIIKTYKPYIIQKNPITSSWYLLRRKDDVGETDEDLQKLDDVKAFIENVISNFDFLTKLKNQIIHNILLYGDCFIEAIDITKETKEIDLKKINVITESLAFKKIEENLQVPNISQSHLDLVIEMLAETVVKDKPESLENEVENYSDIAISNTLIRIHKPHNIIILETKYGTRLGYIEVNKQTSTSLNSVNLTKTLSDITSKISSLSANITRDGTIQSQDIIVNKIISFVLKKVNTDIKKVDEKVIKDLKRFIIEQNIASNTTQLNPIEIKFIPVSRMVSFNLPSTAYHPYGESLVEPLILPSKLFILAQLSNIMTKLSRAPLTRKWIIDQGSVQMPGQLLQKLKRELKNNKIAIEDLSSFKSISKIMSDYKDHFILSKDGKRALDVEVASYGDSSIKVADLEDSRREIIALSGIPAPYLGYMDVVELREQLVDTATLYSNV